MTDSQLKAQSLFTIGHSNHKLGEFIALLKQHHITVVADVRSHPYSRFNPQFNRETLQQALQRESIHYVFLGVELGARRAERECYENGKASYKQIAKTPAFADGLARLRSGMAGHRIALMCAEKDPLTCHRTILVCRAMKDDHLEIQHILDDGSLESMTGAETRLLSLVGLPQEELFRSRDELLDDAYRRQGDRIAYSETELAEDSVTLP